jgi:hypothetical protein
MLPDGDGGLFLATIAVPPGDPAALAAGARTYTAAHGEIERNRAALAAATEQVGGPAWQGTGASSYATFTSNLAATYGLTAAGLAQGATTLQTYSAALAKAQEAARQANAAVAGSNATAGRLMDAQAAAQQAQASADDAAQTATTAENQAAASPLGRERRAVGGRQCRQSGRRPDRRVRCRSRAGSKSHRRGADASQSRRLGRLRGL